MSLIKRLQLVGSSKEKEYLLENLAMMLGSGMSIVPALQAIQTELKSRALKHVISDLISDIDSGIPLSRALEKTGLLTQYMITLIAIGEESGQLSENLKIMAIQQQKDNSLRSKLKSAMLYPVIVFGVTVAVGLSIAWFILPRLASVFKNLKLELPLVTRILIDAAGFLSEYGVIAVPAGVITLALLFYIFFYVPGTKRVGQYFLLHFPGVGQVIKQIELSRLGYLLGNLLHAGLPIVKALHLMSTASTLHRYRKMYLQMAESLEEGNSFQKTFAQIKSVRKIIPAPIQQMIVAGEQSGQLSKSLLNLGEIFEERADLATKNLSVVLEPMLLVIVWLAVISVAIAVILPLYRLIGGLN